MMTKDDLEKEVMLLRSEVKDLREVIKVLYSMIAVEDEEYDLSHAPEVRKMMNT